MVELLCKILQAGNPMASCDPATLLLDAKCFICLTPQQQMAIQTQLLCEILQGAGPTETCIECGVGAPTDPAPCDCSIYYSLEPNPGVWVWDNVDAEWDAVIGAGP